MITIALRFLSGHFHATPWGRHVNEGNPEWPPSPWRLLRTMVASWKIKSPSFTEDEVRDVLLALSMPPHFHLPSATTGHTRHYMRWYKKGPEDQTLVFDAFVCLDRMSDVIVQWPDVQLKDTQRELLNKLLEQLNYLGRSESWCEARLLQEEDLPPIVPNCFPLNGGSPKEGEEIVRVLCADPTTALESEHVKPLTKGKKNTRPPYEPAWHICIETAQLHSERWSDPPGSQWVQYVRRSDCFSPSIRKVKVMNIHKSKIQVVRYALDSTVLPLLQETLPVAEAARRALLGSYGRLHWNKNHPGEEYPAESKERPKSEVFSGKDADGRPLQNHLHAYYLPTDEDGDGRLDHLTLYSPSGFERGSCELQALDRLRFIKRFEESSPLRVVLMGMGSEEDYQPLPLRKSCVWVSATPFIATRHPKAKGQKRDPIEALQNDAAFLAFNLREELDRLSQRTGNPLYREASITPLVNEQGVFRISPGDWVSEGLSSAAEIRPIQFKRFRARKTHPGQMRAGAFRITFQQPVRGPIALGLHSHYGMGMFLAHIQG